jgi:uncharacterized protein (TIGR03000 family)
MCCLLLGACLLGRCCYTDGYFCGCQGWYASPCGYYGASGWAYPWDGGYYPNYWTPLYASGGHNYPSPSTAVAQQAPSGGQSSVEDEIRTLRERLSRLEAVKADTAAAPAAARVVVKLPPDARFFIDDRPWSLDTATHSFQTPQLKRGQTYEYTLRTELTRGGRTTTERKRVQVRAGEETVVEFRDAVQLASQ